MIFYELEKSPYTYLFNNITFYFSSEFYLKKFEKEVDNYIKNEEFRFFQRYKLKLETNYFRQFLAISFYKKVEKRGFYFTSNECKVFDDFFI